MTVKGMRSKIISCLPKESHENQSFLGKKSSILLMFSERTIVSVQEIAFLLIFTGGAQKSRRPPSFELFISDCLSYCPLAKGNFPKTANNWIENINGEIGFPLHCNVTK